jgi:hypothetical protein
MPMFAMDLEVLLFQNSLGLVGAVGVFAAMLVGVYARFRGLKDLARFGRSGAPWLVAVIFASILGGGALWLWGAYGSVVIFVVLAAFAWGKLRPA